MVDFDFEAFRAVHLGLRSVWLDPIMWALSYSGLGAMQALYSLYWLRYSQTKHRVLPLLLTLIVSGLGVAQALKLFLPRDRPSNLRIAVPSEEFYSKSFPSGHTATAFAMAMMMILLTYRSRRWWHGPLAWLWAIGVGISRIYRGVHWPSDVLTGAFAGIFAACALWLILPDRWKGHEA